MNYQHCFNNVIFLFFCLMVCYCTPLALRYSIAGTFLSQSDCRYFSVYTKTLTSYMKIAKKLPSLHLCWLQILKVLRYHIYSKKHNKYRGKKVSKNIF